MENVLTPRPSRSEGASSVASRLGDGERDAWSCPLPSEVFAVGPQGQGEDIAGHGVAIALAKLLSEWRTPARHASQTLNPLPHFSCRHDSYALPAWQGWLPPLFNETAVPLTGLGAPLPSFPFVDPDHGLEQPPPRVLHQFVMVLVDRFRMSVAEIVMAYSLVRVRTPQPPTRPATHHPAPAAHAPYLKTSLHAITRLRKHSRSTQTCCVATRSARSFWAAAYWRSR